MTKLGPVPRSGCFATKMAGIVTVDLLDARNLEVGDILFTLQVKESMGVY